MSSRAMRSHRVALIDEARCIGCTLCIEACPFDAILGAPMQMHSVLTGLCTGCDLCVAPCPVDCIAMVPAADAKWDRSRALAARQRFKARKLRLARDEAERARQPGTKAEDEHARAESCKRTAIEAAIERARARRAAAKGATGGRRGTQS